MKNNTMWIIVLAFLVFTSCNSKKTSETTEDEGAATEKATGEALGADAEILEGMNVYFVNIKEGDTVTSPVTVEMGVNGMEVEPAGELSRYKGHHHIIIDGSFEPKGIVVPADSTHIHFGQAQTTTELDLTPGEHTLTLQFADGQHRSYGKKMSIQIKITVE